MSRLKPTAIVLIVAVLVALTVVAMLRHAKRDGSASHRRPFGAKPNVYSKIVVPNRSRRRQVASPTRNFVFIKIHKTGSASIRQMLEKVIKNHNLIEVVPKSRTFGFGRYFDPSTYYHSHKPGEYNALIAHSRFKPSVTNRLIRNPVYFTILRNPETLFLSAFDYFPHVRKCAGGIGVSPIDVLDNPSTYFPKLQKCKEHFYIVNSMANEMGLDPPYLDDDVQAKIREMEKTFGLVMIMEHSAESMVMLRRTLNWNLSDVVGMPTNTHPEFKSDDETLSDYEKLIAHHEANVLTEKHKAVLRHWLHADFLIYERFLKIFEEKIRKEEEETGDFQAEVELYKEAMVALCKGKGIEDMHSAISRLKHGRLEMFKWYTNKRN